MLVENTMFGDKDKIAEAIERLKFAYNKMAVPQNLGPLYVAFSGGKDSIVIAELAKMAKVPYELHYNVTGIDPKEVLQFMKENYKELIWHRPDPEKTIWKLIVKKHMPPTRLIRYCCSELKEKGGAGRVTVTGVRWAESNRRKNNRKPYETGATKKEDRMLFNDNAEDRKLFEQCILKGKFICNPIIDWTDKDVWDFIKHRNLKYCSLYDNGFKRIGCIGCPMAPVHMRVKELNAYPGFKKKYIQSFQKMLEAMPDKAKDWQSGQDVFNWWLYGEKSKIKKSLYNNSLLEN